MKRALKITRKIFFWIFFVGLFLTTLTTVILYIYEDEIKQYAIDELNDHLRTEFQAEDIELSFLYDFPQASIEFKNVFVADAYPQIKSEDTLFFAKSMFFNFNLLDLYSGDYKVQRISLHDGGLYLRTSEDGQVNFDILKEDDNGNEQEGSFDFLLELLEVENFEFRYRNLAARQFYDLRINSGLFRGNFSQDNFDVLSEADLKIHRVKSNSFTLIKNKEADLNLDLAVNTLDRSYRFKKGDLIIEEMPFHVTGVIDSTNIDLNISGDDIQLDELVNTIVDDAVDNVKKYEGQGTVNFISHIHGPLSSTKMPSIEAEFDISKGSLYEPEKKLSITDVSFIGYYKNEQDEREEQLNLRNVRLKMLDSYFNGEATVSDFSKPMLSTSMEGNIDLGRFHKFFDFRDVALLSGKMDFNCRASLQFHDPEYNARSFDILQSEGVFNLNKIQYKSDLDNITYKEISGEIVLKGKDAAANGMKIRTNRSDIAMDGAMKNLMSFIDGSGSLGLIATIESEHFDLNEFVDASASSSQGPPKKFEIPSNINLNIDLEVGQLDWSQHQFKDISTKMLMTNRTVDMKNISLNLLGGHLRGNMQFKNLVENGNFIDGHLWFTGVDITALFKEWNNFNQTSLTHQHLSGRASGDIDLLLTFNPYMSLIEDKLYTQLNLKIEDGKLEELEAMKTITDYMRTNAALKLLLNRHIDRFEQKLLHLQFSDIVNTITIQDRKVIIPKMKIHSNALDVDVYGWHDFDNQIEYHFSFRFRELKTQVTENEFGIIEDDGLGFVVYLVMYGDMNDPVVATDSKERKNDLRVYIADEKEDIKSMLKSDFGFFKKDSTVKRIERDNKSEVEFIIYDDDQHLSGDTLPNEVKKNKKHTLKFFDKLKKESEENKNDEIEYETEVE